jgi:hypothetical protein
VLIIWVSGDLRVPGIGVDLVELSELGPEQALEVKLVMDRRSP